MRVILTFGIIASILGSAVSNEKQYIVTFKDENSFPAKIGALVKETLGKLPLADRASVIISEHYSHAIKGFVAGIPFPLIPLIQSLPWIENIEEDAKIQLYDVQEGAPWGLARMSQRERLSRGPHTYEYDETSGEGVAVYVIDSGVRISHSQFDGRAVVGKTFVGDNDDDENGHGTHVAGTIAGRTYGVAKRAQIISCKVFDKSGRGALSHTISAIEWALNDKRGKKGNVINMSLGSARSEAVNRAVDSAYRAGMTVVVAAGNSNEDAIFYSPASAGNAITVGATTINDTLAYFSNYGFSVDILAPGQDILSSWNTDDYATNVISGTSMASPHVAGLAAYFHSLEKVSNEKMSDLIKSASTKGAIRGTHRLKFPSGRLVHVVNDLANNIYRD